MFDTTASNTGVTKGAAIRLHNLLQCHIFYLGCRHHIAELHAKNPWYAVFKADPSPDNQMFKKLRDIWPEVDTTEDIKTINIPDKALHQQMKEFYEKLLVKENQRKELLLRADYRELAEISLVILGGELPGDQPIHWKKPGAIHKARFMAFGISSLKLLAFSGQQVVRDSCFSLTVKEKKTKKFVFDQDQLDQLQRFCHFALMFYIPQFLTAARGADAPFNDLQLYKNLNRFKTTDETLANKALDTLSRHLWYLAPTTVLFSLFSNLVTEEEKSGIAAKLLSLPRDSEIQFGIPKFPELTVTTQLRDLVTPQSWQFFEIVQVSPDWLALPPAEWASSEDFRLAREYIQTLKVTNDTAERLPVTSCRS